MEEMNGIAPDLLEIELVRGYLQPGDVAVDVGACTGLYTKVCADAVGPAGTVHAIEPDATNFRKLLQYVASHGLENVRMYMHASVEKAGPQKLYLNKDNSGDHHTWEDPDDLRESVEVAGILLDSLIEDSVQFIKIDVQGAELEVLRGAEKLMERSRTLAMLIEWWPYGLLKNGQGTMDMIRYLIRLGFDVYYIDSSGGGFLYKLDEIVNLVPDYGRRDLADVWANLWCLRGVALKRDYREIDS